MLGLAELSPCKFDLALHFRAWPGVRSLMTPFVPHARRARSLNSACSARRLRPRRARDRRAPRAPSTSSNRAVVRIVRIVRSLVIVGRRVIMCANGDGSVV